MGKLLISLLLCAAASAFARDGGFLFVTFKGETTPMTEQVYFGLSKDGYKWEALNGSEPVLTSAVGEKGVRDPYILRSHDGQKFFLIATDLSINLTQKNGHQDWERARRAGSKSIVIWESKDLAKWSEPRLVPIAVEDAGCTWAPEAVYDRETQDYLVFWASKTGRDGFAKHRLWAARTKDFKTFGRPFIYIKKPYDVIDTTIIFENGTYYRFSKDEKNSATTFESSKKLMGPWEEVNEFSLKHLRGYEGPTCFILERAAAGKPATWGVLLDYYIKGKGYQPYVTRDLAGGQFTPAPEITFPFHFRHGSVLPITAQEYARLSKTYPVASAAKASNSSN